MAFLGTRDDLRYLNRELIKATVDARTHAKIATGKSENKFGIPIARARAVYARAATLPGLNVTGVDMHIGSQITDLSRMETAFRILAEFVQTLRADGHSIFSATPASAPPHTIHNSVMPLRSGSASSANGV